MGTEGLEPPYSRFTDDNQIRPVGCPTNNALDVLPADPIRVHPRVLLVVRFRTVLAYVIAITVKALPVSERNPSLLRHGLG